MNKRKTTASGLLDATANALGVHEQDGQVLLSNGSITLCIERETGQIASLLYRGKELLKYQSGGERGNQGIAFDFWISEKTGKLGLYRLANVENFRVEQGRDRLGSYRQLALSGKAVKHRAIQEGADYRFDGIDLELQLRLYGVDRENGSLLRFNVTLYESAGKGLDGTMGLSGCFLFNEDAKQIVAWLPTKCWSAQRLGSQELVDNWHTHSLLRPAGVTACYLDPHLSHPIDHTYDKRLNMPLAQLASKAIPLRVSAWFPMDRPARIELKAGDDGCQLYLMTRFTLGEGDLTKTRKVDLPIYLYLGEHSWEAPLAKYHDEVYPDPIKVPQWLQDLKVMYWDMPVGGKLSAWYQDIDALIELGVTPPEVLCGIHGIPSSIDLDYLVNPDGSINTRWTNWRGQSLSLEEFDQRVKYATERGYSVIFCLTITTSLIQSSTIYRQIGEKVVFRDEQERPKLAHYMDLSQDRPELSKSGLRVYHASISSEDWRANIKTNVRFLCERYEDNPYFKGVCIEEPWVWDGPVGHPVWDMDSFDHTPDRAGPVSPYAIGFLKDLRAMIRSIRSDLILVVNTCALAGFAYWADGESGDSRMVIEHLSSLGNKPYINWVWWPLSQLDFNIDNVFRNAGTVGFSNNYGDNRGPSDMTHNEWQYYLDLIRRAKNITGLSRFNHLKMQVYISNPYFTRADEEAGGGDRSFVFGDRENGLAVSLHNRQEEVTSSNIDTFLFEAKGIRAPAHGYGCVVVRKKGKRQCVAQYSGVKGTVISLIIKLDVTEWNNTSVKDLTDNELVVCQLQSGQFPSFEMMEGHEYYLVETR